MEMTFKNALVLDKFQGVSKAGNPFGTFRFIGNNILFRVFVPGDELSKLERIESQKVYPELRLQLVADRNGNPSFRL